ncbi:c-type cytochrome [Sphingomonas radiodurans]|uniref:c-type cytochrome n=1 Tax=Sphingomonas radiodurans TaxID=2890321 RepID=UPI001E4C8013|nr:c-type cytochrome [Sphingomonas radiodurans]WBH17431.1 c-type cytochrome [Sphingomonas radiodurans]
MIGARTTGSMMALALCGLAAPALAQDANAGATIFRQRCSLCHGAAPGARATLGPNLAGVGGRPAASTDFKYSAALKASKLTWDKATLDKFLTAPTKLVPGTRMVIATPDAAQRAQVIAYLLTLKP